MNDGQLLAELIRVQAAFQLRAIQAVMGIPAQADTHPKGGDSLEAPAPLSGTVGPAGDAPNLQPLSPKDQS